ncbi:MAG: nucleotide exchange factor GrpE [Verrucomicrobiota bacterium]
MALLYTSGPMQDPTTTAAPRWPFFTAAAALAGLAFALGWIHPGASESAVLAGSTASALGAAALVVIPFILDYRARTLQAQADRLADAVERLDHLEQLAAQIGYATSQWHLVRESADKTARSARDIAQGMAVEVKNFSEFLQRANDGEKNSLRLEVDKLRRAEGEWLQVLIRMLDHVFALNQAALRSGQPKLVEQIGQFQSVCHDAVRRIGLAPFVPAPAERFDQQRHQVFEGNGQPAGDAAVHETIAAGFTYQGRMLRPALVRLKNGSEELPNGN